jgi:hypothetical protein
MVLRLEPRRVSPELQLEQDGSLRGCLKEGDYALIANRHALAANGTSDLERQDMHVVALLRVPSNAIAAYAGVLVLVVKGRVVDLQHLQTDYEFGEARVSTDPPSIAQESLEQALGPPPGSPVVCIPDSASPPGTFVATRRQFEILRLPHHMTRAEP